MENLRRARVSVIKKKKKIKSKQRNIEKWKNKIKNHFQWTTEYRTVRGMGKSFCPLDAFNPPTLSLPCSSKRAPVEAEALLWVSTKFDDPNDVTLWAAATALAEHYHNSPTSWAFPDYLDLTSQRENDFKDWTSCPSFSKIQELEATDSPSLLSTCTTKPENELSPLESSGGHGSSTLGSAGLCTQSCMLVSVIVDTRKRKTGDSSFSAPPTGSPLSHPALFLLQRFSNKSLVSKVHLESQTD